MTSKVFVIEGGRLVLRKPFPKRLSDRRRLELSIEKWAVIEAYHQNTETSSAHLDGIDSSTCALCAKYAKNMGCAGCPVSAYTGENDCSGTPYYRYDKKHTAKNAHAEKKFLLKLLGRLP